MSKPDQAADVPAPQDLTPFQR
jgi:hypothetical protein